jgi:radical SAM/Cys-rich protein
MRPFTETFKSHGLDITRFLPETLQVNMGKLCNQACLHCHVEAGPTRAENMEGETFERLLLLIKNSPFIKTVDLTGGAPELNPYFKKLVTTSRMLQMEVIDRCNLSVLFEPGQEDTALFLKENKVRVIASLPCYSKENVDAQRGKDVFEKSIRGLRLLNSLGYGSKDLVLDLVYNPIGPFLPPGQKKLEDKYRSELKELFGIDFNSLFTITNMPIKRFLDDLERNYKLNEYMELLVDSFNPASGESLMCRSLISIGWDGKIYDCDFNQMLEIPIGNKSKTIWDISSFEELSKEPIAFANHCYGCSAGEGSSCKGALV